MTNTSVLIALALAALSFGSARAAEPPPPESPAAPPVETPAADRIALFTSGEPEYERLRFEPGGRTAPEAVERLVVFQEGQPVLDLGLRSEYRLIEGPQGTAEEVLEEGIVENAEIAPDGRSAVILSTRFRRAAYPAASPPGTGKQPRPYGETVLTWVDARRPNGRFSIELKDGRWVKEVIPLSAGSGLVVSTTRGLDAPADLEIFGADGRATFKVSEVEATVNDIAATNNGAFLAASLAYPERPGLPQQGVLVFDLLRGTRWTYTWSYGGEGEPISWNLEESGVLELRLPGRIVRYDRNGTPIGSTPAGNAGSPAPTGRR